MFHPSALRGDDVILRRYKVMKNNVNDNNKPGLSLDDGGFIARTLRHEALKKGIAAAAAGVLFAIASEALFPSNES